jgi:hypothetical protein
MPVSRNIPLNLSRQLVRILIDLNLAMGVGILAMLIAALVDGHWVAGALGVPIGDNGPPLIGAMKGIMLLGLAGVAVTHFALARLRAIVATVTEGDPFVTENGDRLQQIAWAMVGLELLRIAVGFAATLASTRTAAFNLGWKFSPTPWLAILLLFVLARVFEQGARMRDDLEGTV